MFRCLKSIAVVFAFLLGTFIGQAYADSADLKQKITPLSQSAGSSSLPSAKDYIITVDASSPKMKCIDIPIYEGVASWNIRTKTGNTWTAFQKMMQGGKSCFGGTVGVDAIEFQPLNASGNNIVLPDSPLFQIDYASTGTVHATIQVAGPAEEETTSMFSDEDYPLTPASVYVLPKGTLGSDMAWLNNYILVIQKINPENRKARKDDDIYFWNVKTKTATLAATSNYWCVSDGNFAFEKAREKTQDYLRLTIVRKTPNGQQEFTTSDLSAGMPFQEHIPWGTRGYNPDSFKASEKFNPFDCSWTSSKEYAAIYPSYAWEYLRPGDGAIAFLANPKDEDWAHPERAVVHYESNINKPITLPIKSIGLDINSVRYYEFRKAYFITVPEYSEANPNMKDCQSAWWFEPIGNHVEQICTSTEFLRNQEMSYLPSKKGVLRLVSLRKTSRDSEESHDSVEGGIYLTDDKGQTTKIWGGMASGGATSPDGCLVAVNSVKTAPVVLELCK